MRPTFAPAATGKKAARESLVIRVEVLVALVAAAAAAASPALAGERGALVACRAAPAVTRPQPMPSDYAPAAPLCPAGQVPQPIGRVTPKGMPQIRERTISGVASDADDELYYLYAATFHQGPSLASQGKFTQDQPYVAPEDYHSLAELAGESADAQNIIEVGWTVDPSLNGDSNPHLFVFHWVAGAPTCYNGCGYVQVSTTRYPGMPVTVSAQPQPFAIRFDGTNWWIGYQNEWIGYFPGSLWAGGFTLLGITQWFGEVAASGPTPCTQMGDGVIGTGVGAARVAAQRVGTSPAAALPGEVTDPAYYALGALNGKGYRFGGPGAC
jgi:hypothetical protein